MMVERVLSLEGGYVIPWSHCASWSCQRTHHHYIGRLRDGGRGVEQERFGCRQAADVSRRRLDLE